MDNIWAIPYINSQAKERVGYPTQKPLKLLERIIKASSNKGDIVLDPFCGCATTCVAADGINRQWIGIDVSQKAFELVKKRLKEQVESKGDLWENISKKVIYREDIPIRSDIKDTMADKEKRQYLYGVQEGDCNLCNTHFDGIRHFHLDHITPKSKGGTDHLQNRQLLCGNCNQIKSNKTMAEAMVIAREKGIVKEIKF